MEIKDRGASTCPDDKWALVLMLAHVRASGRVLCGCATWCFFLVSQLTKKSKTTTIPCKMLVM